MLHQVDGTVRTLVLDLDTSKARKTVVDDDARRLGEILRAAGLAYVEDESPSGGRHLYVPLQDPLTAAEARQLVEALGRRAVSLDPSPHQNIVHGCIRVPGSAHKAGGHQRLITQLTDAYGILTRRNPTTAVANLRTALAPELYRIEQQRRTQERAAAAAAAVHAIAKGSTASSAPVAGSERPLRLVARTGLYDTSRYASDSEARMAVLNHFAACHWTLNQVRAGMTDQYPGLAALYGTKTVRLLPVEWAKAQTFTATSAPAKTPAQRAGKKTAHKYDTSPTYLTGGSSEPSIELSQHSIHQLVNDLENVLYTTLDYRLMERGREGIHLRFLIRAVLAYMRTMETNVLDVGCRTFALALGKSHATIARLLPVLEQASAGILTRIDRGRGRNADTYAVQLPEHFQQLAREFTWRKGKIHAIRPVFRVLGDVSALAYEAIERGHQSPTTADLARTTGISRRALTDHLAGMEALQMVRRHRGRWELVATTNLNQLADRLGATEDREAQLTRYRKERAAWHAWLDRHLVPQLEEHELYDAEADEYWQPPIEDEYEHQRALWVAAGTVRKTVCEGPA
ncbi:hypothetical protein PTW37_17025 (plasmid) [Arthrobacter agilis]|uniref:hypothetical protein n=1 Tax=Arthrobacter agilis TaxID=37921 RepID=UPI0023663966|nr:hypothetical protein [Arthrobacter agilis]WDF35052.1 hypothetical protein PTW37_17025 [Arthrobacter agilis]